MEKKIEYCSICGKPLPDGVIGRNNAWPVNDGTCCDECNMNTVIPARILDLNAAKVINCLDFEEVEDGIEQLRSLHTGELITDELYDHIIKNWDRLVLKGAQTC